MSDARLVGTWALERFTLALPNGHVIEPLGSAPIGRLVYTEAGFMSAHLMPDESVPDGGAARVATLGYCGRWRVEGDRVLHEVEISSRPGMTGTTQVRPMAFEGETLVLTSERARAGAGEDVPIGVGTLRWRRIDGPVGGGKAAP